jgi:hypothetical protein
MREHRMEGDDSYMALGGGDPGDRVLTVWWD